MTQKSPKLLCNTILLFFLLLSASFVHAQMDLDTANSLIKFEWELADNSIESAGEDLVIFKETGKGRLSNGSAEIKIDPEIADKIEGNRIDDLVKVSIQMEGKSNGVFVSWKDKDTFAITELNSGNSNSHFSYQFTVRSR